MWRGIRPGSLPGLHAKAPPLGPACARNSYDITKPGSSRGIFFIREMKVEHMLKKTPRYEGCLPLRFNGPGDAFPCSEGFAKPARGREKHGPKAVTNYLYPPRCPSTVAESSV